MLQDAWIQGLSIAALPAAMNDTFDSPTIPMALFRKMVASLPPEALAKLPPEKLPDHIPLDIVEEAPIYSRSAVENLVMAANSFHLGQRLEIQARHGDEVLAALDISKASGHTANLRIFHNKLSELDQWYGEWKQTQHTEVLARLTANIKAVNPLLLDIRAEKIDLQAAVTLLGRQSYRYESYAERFRTALQALKVHITRIEALLAHYYRLRLLVTEIEMQAKTEQIQQLDEHTLTLSLEIDALREQLERSQSLWKRTLRRSSANKEAELLQAQIMALVAQRQANEAAISENDLTLWLDALVDASLHPDVREQIVTHLGNTRTHLYTLLIRYCQQQETSAMQIARNPFLQIDPAQAIRFVLLSEQFILDYFSRKRHQNTAWISDMAQVRIEDLDSIERTILTELKRSSRFMRK